MISDYFTFALRNINKRKLRSSLTILGIVISIATIFMLISISLGLQAAVEEQFRALGTDKFFLQPKGQPGGPGTAGAVMLTLKDVDAIEKVSGVKDLSYWTAGNGEVKVGSQRRFVPVIGIPLDRSAVFEEIEAYVPEEGRPLRKGDLGSVMIGSQYKHNNFFDKEINAGDTLTINGQPFKVRAVLVSRGNPSDDRLIYMPYEDFQSLFHTGERIDQLVVQVDTGQNISEVASRVERRLRNFRGVTEKTQDFTILTPEELLDSFGAVLNILTGFLVGVAAISLVVGGIGIATTMYTSVLERIKEIGVMKAIGAKNKDILTIFLIESGILGFMGGVLGVLLGLTVSKTIEYIAVHNLGTTLLRAATPPSLILGCLLFAFLAGSLSGIWPAWHATQIQPVKALRYE